MRAVIQRVSSASVTVESETVGQIAGGLLVLLGVSPGDDAATAAKLAAKTVALRIFEDTDARMNLDIRQVGGAVLCISQFTLYGDVRKGNRPSFTGAAEPGMAAELYEQFCSEIRAAGVACETGRFGAEMHVSLVNNGPVTILVDSDDLARPRG